MNRLFNGASSTAQVIQH